MSRKSIKKEQLNVRIPAQLLRRIKSIIGASGETIADFVTDILERGTAEYENMVGPIRAKREAEKQKQDRMKP